MIWLVIYLLGVICNLIYTIHIAAKYSNIASGNDDLAILVAVNALSWYGLILTVMCTKSVYGEFY